MEFNRLKFSLSNRLLIAIFGIIIASSLVISVLVTYQYSDRLLKDMLTKAERDSHVLSLEAADSILLNDLAGLQRTLNHHISSNSSIGYIFVVREKKVLAHTFPGLVPSELLNINDDLKNVSPSFNKIKTRQGIFYFDIAYPIASGKLGILRLGVSVDTYEEKLFELWIQINEFSLPVFIIALISILYVIKKTTTPLSDLARATDELGEGFRDVSLQSENKEDEVGKLTTTFNQMAARTELYSLMLEKRSQDLDRAHHQTRACFEIIPNIWAKQSFSGASTYLVNKFQKLVPCSKMVLLVISSNRESMFLLSDKLQTRILKKESFQSNLDVLEKISGLTFMRKNTLTPPVVPDDFQTSKRLAVFPIYHEAQFFGALVVACTNDCSCDGKELELIELILQQTSGALKRVVLLEEEVHGLCNRAEHMEEFCGIIGKGPRMQEIYKLIKDIAPTDATVLIQGESGTGKELVARAIHRNSLRRDKPFIVINCAAYPATLLESELFGHEKGAFTGANRQKIGRFEQAQGGTVFLDEIGEISHSAQIKLLRVLQTRKIERLSGEQTLAVDVRILAATNRVLVEEVKKGNFREDLFYRLNVIPIIMPTLRSQRNDIPLLARYFLRQFADENNKETQELSSAAMRLLLDYPWPGNVRELENTIEHAVVLAKGVRIEVADLPSALSQATPDTRNNTSRTIVENESILLSEVLEECNWNKTAAAERLGISRSTLYEKIKKYQLTNPAMH